MNKKTEDIGITILVVLGMLAIIGCCCGGFYGIPAASYAFIDAVFGTEITVNFLTVSGWWVSLWLLLFLIGAFSNDEPRYTITTEKD